MDRVKGTKSPFSGWIGGKSQLSNRIIGMIPEDHTCYVELFAGAGWTFFKKEPSKVEVVNDINKELITLYRVLQHHLTAFVDSFKWTLNSRDEFERWLKADPETLTDIQRATRFYYTLKNSFGGRISGKPTFGYAPSRQPRLNLLRIEEELSAGHLRLAGTYIECLPYAEIIKRYDRPETFFYCDPPYWGCEDYYGKEIFSREDFAQLAELLGKIKGRCLISLNDTPEVREIFQVFQIDEATCTYSAGKGTRPKANEVLIRNYDLA